MTESPSQPIEFPNASARAGFIVGLNLCSKVLWETALRIKDDPSQGYSECLGRSKSACISRYQRLKGIRRGRHYEPTGKANG